jgi:hypothetical protein
MTILEPEVGTSTGEVPLSTNTVAPSDFEFGALDQRMRVLDKTKPVVTPAPPPLGVLAKFVGTFAGNGFNTIFRPQNPTSPPALTPPVPGDNILELNLTAEVLSFAKSLGTVPNRGFSQRDVLLNGVPYLQTINDVTDLATGRTVDREHGIGIHFEPGLWMAVPQTQDPAEGPTYVRMASIPHGTTVTAQGTAATKSGPPSIPAAPITPFGIGQPGHLNRFASQDASTQGTARLPQDLTKFIAAGTITQAILDDPNTVLRNAIAHQKIIETTTLTVSTGPAAPLFGGGTDNIAFLLGDPANTTENARTVSMAATFWIETVEETIVIPPIHGDKGLILDGQSAPGHPFPRFHIPPGHTSSTARKIAIHYTQIQYSQLVLLNFGPLSWPHVSVATLVPHQPIPVPFG